MLCLQCGTEKPITGSMGCLRLMSTAIYILVDDMVYCALSELCMKTGNSKREIVEDALRQYMFGVIK